MARILSNFLRQSRLQWMTHVSGLLFGLALLLPPAVTAAPLDGTETVQITPRPAQTFAPTQAFGAGVDGLEAGAVAQVYTPANVRAMSTVGFGPLTYRLRTELGVETWHWNPQGRWSDPRHREGYWASDAQSSAPIRLSYGYRLPRRGSTTDQANNDGYSRLDDGDGRTFWKSNPYLDRHFTGESNALHPQWVVIDLGRKRSVDMLRIQWGVPYATRYQAAYWVGGDNPSDGLGQTYEAGTHWRAFPLAMVSGGMGGAVRLRLADRPVRARFVRLWMTESSGVPTSTGDVRDGLGYAIRELELGRTDAAGHWHDWIRHSARHDTQTEIYASSTDPWHTASGRDPQVEQPGFDRVLGSDLTHRLPVLVPVGLIYDTPDNAVSELRFLKSRGEAIRGVEMGEEPDGQFMTPEDYGALYVQWADALHGVDPALRLGGPCFQTNIDGWSAWPDAHGNRSWMNRFVRYLKRRGHLEDFGFFSFEWYPFDDVCAPPAGQLPQEPTLLAQSLGRLQREGLPRTIPWLMTEYGYSAFAGQAEMDMPGALLNAEIAAQFLTLGGTTAYLYGLEPNTPMRELSTCPTFGNLAVFLSDDDRHIRAPLATLYGERLLTQEWALPGSPLPHDVYRVTSDVRNGRGQPLVTAYAVHRPDGRWAVLMLNKDPKRAAHIRLRFRATTGGSLTALRAPFRLVQYSPAQYRWQPQGTRGHPSLDRPPVVSSASGGMVVLPPYSMTIARGSLRRSIPNRAEVRATEVTREGDRPHGRKRGGKGEGCRP